MWINTTRRVLWTDPYKEIMWDLDGTLTGYANGWLTPHYKWNDWAPHCVQGNSTFDHGTVCDGTAAVRRLQVYGVNPQALDWQVCVAVHL